MYGNKHNPSPPPQRPPDKYERFEAWLRENGARFDLLELREYDCNPPAAKLPIEDEEEKKEPAASILRSSATSSSAIGAGQHQQPQSRRGYLEGRTASATVAAAAAAVSAARPARTKGVTHLVSSSSSGSGYGRSSSRGYNNNNNNNNNNSTGTAYGTSTSPRQQQQQQQQSKSSSPLAPSRTSPPNSSNATGIQSLYRGVLVHRSQSTSSSHHRNRTDGDEDETKGTRETTPTTDLPSTDEDGFVGDDDEDQRHLHHVQQDVEDAEGEESEMRGVHARVHIPPNTLCMAIPRRCLITVEMGQATPIGQAILSSDLDLDAPKHIFLMIYVLWDRKVHGANSFFHPYYEVLPQTLSNMPIFWTDEELAELQGSYLLHQIRDRNLAITEDYQAICQIAPLARICTLDEFKWARMCVCSRNFGLQIDGHRTSALVPHADMLNHYRPRETKWTFDEDRQAFTITSLQHIPAGAQVYDSYGQKCNHRFLLNYGFAVEDNREMDGFCPNEVPIELYVHPDDPLHAEKLEFWNRGEASSAINSQHPHHQQQQQQQPYSPGGTNAGAYGCQPSPSDIKRVRICVSNNENTRLLLSLLRALACNQAELRLMSAPPPSPPIMHHADNTSSTSSAMFHPQAQLPQHHSAAHNKSYQHHFPYNNPLQQQSPSSGTASSHHSNYHQAPHHSNYHKVADVRSNPLFGGFAHEPRTTKVHGGGHVSSSAGSGITYLRSCRDIRHPISLRNERAAMRLMLNVMSRHLSRYPTTLAQDMADLMDEDVYPRFSNKRHAKIQVRGEKEVLHHFCIWARTALDVMDVLEEELREEERGGSPGANNVEVQLTGGGRLVAAAEEQRHNFDSIIRRMEEDVDKGVHHTILRYCADTLGSLRREELKNLRRQYARNSSSGQERKGNGVSRTTGYL